MKIMHLAALQQGPINWLGSFVNSNRNNNKIDNDVFQRTELIYINKKYMIWH